MKNLLKLAVILGCLVPSLALAEKGVPPKGRVMKEYMERLIPYVEYWGQVKAEKRNLRLKVEAPMISKVALAYAKSGIVSSLTNGASSLDLWDEWYDGSMAAEANKEAAREEMLVHSLDCGGVPKPSGICYYCPFPLVLNEEYEYFLPVQLIEITDTPWKTGYAMPAEVGVRKKAAIVEKYGSSPKELATILSSEQTFMRKEIEKYGFDKSNLLNSLTGENALSGLFDSFSSKISEISGDLKMEEIAADMYKRAITGKNTFTTARTPGGVYAFPHIFNTGFNDRYKKEFTGQWGHDGAMLAQRDEGNACNIKPRSKRLSPGWFAEGTREFWYPSFALKKTGLLSGLPKIQLITIDGKRTGRPHNYAKAGNFTPEDILSEDAKRQLENDLEPNCGTYILEETIPQAKCLTGQNGEKGPTVALVKDQYFTRASMIAAWRGLFWVTNIIDDDTRLPQSSRVDENTKTDQLTPFLYHPFFNRIQKDGRPRSRMQVLNDSTGGKYSGIVNGCTEFRTQLQFIPDWSGPEFGDANTPQVESHNNQTVLVQWQYMKNCRKDYNLFFSPKSSHQYWF